MFSRTLAAALVLALPAAAQVATPAPQPPEDLLARPDTYPGADLAVPSVPAGSFRPAVPGCIGPGLPQDGYGDVPACYDPAGEPAPRPGIVVIPLD